MSAYALRATVLLFIDVRPGEWVSHARIRDHVQCRDERVCNVLEQLVEANLVQHCSGPDGTRYYGVRCDGLPVPGGEPA